MTIATTIIEGLNFYELRAVRHKARMEQRRERYLNPPKRIIDTMVPHPAVFEKPADRKLWPDFLAKLALRCEVSLKAPRSCAASGTARASTASISGTERMTRNRRRGDVLIATARRGRKPVRNGTTLIVPPYGSRARRAFVPRSTRPRRAWAFLTPSRLFKALLIGAWIMGG